MAPSRSSAPFRFLQAFLNLFLHYFISLLPPPPRPLSLDCAFLLAISTPPTIRVAVAAMGDIRFRFTFLRSATRSLSGRLRNFSRGIPWEGIERLDEDVFNIGFERYLEFVSSGNVGNILSVVSVHKIFEIF